MQEPKSILFILFLLVSTSVPTLSQKIETDFGQNRIQYKSKDWKYYDSKNFSIHYYGEYSHVAKQAIIYLENHFNEITDAVGFSPFMKLKLFLYASNSDLLQSNVGLNYDMYTINGKAELIKSYIELAHPGNMEDLKKELNFHVYKLIIKDMMASNVLEDFLQEASIAKIPTWFIDGGARYLAYGWDAEMDDFVRSLIDKKRVHLETYTGENAALIGQSIWNFIAQKYHQNNIPNILNLTRMLEDEEKGIAKTLGLNYKVFLKEWKTYYETQNNASRQHYLELEENLSLKRNRNKAQYTGVAFSSDGKQLIYGLNDHGKIIVKLRRLEENSEKTILLRSYKTPSQENLPKYPIVAWKDEKTVAIIASEFGQNLIWLYNTETGERMRRELPKKINQINSLEFFKKNGRVALISAESKGRTSVYALSLTRFTVKSLSKDIYDDLYPDFIPDRNAFVFSSNRTKLYSNPKQKAIDYDSISDDFNLYIYHFDSAKDNRISLLKHSAGHDKMPQAVNQNLILFLADYQGVHNLYSYNLRDSISTQISKFNYGIKQYAYHAESKQLAMVSFKKGREQLYLVPDFDVETNKFTVPTIRKNTLNKEFRVKEFLLKREKSIADSLENLKLEQAREKELRLIEEQKLAKDSTTLEPSVIGKNVTFSYLDSNRFTTNIAYIRDSAQKIDTDNYEFDPIALQKTKPRPSYLMKYRMEGLENVISEPLPYKERFRIDNVSMSVIIDPYWETGTEARIQMNDLLEDHRFILDLRTDFSLENGELDFSYHYLKKRIDFKARYFRKGMKAKQFNQSSLPTSSTFEQKYKLNRFELGASLPFSTFSRVEVNPFFTNTNFHSLTTPNSTNLDTTITHNYVGGELAIVFDNTEVMSLNSYKGFRSKLSLETYQGLGSEALSFSNLNLDTRYYFPIYKEIVIASRFFYGRYFGKAKRSYLLGGVDNWLFSKTKGTGNEATENDPLRVDPQTNNENLLFLNYLTGLRGFDYNTFNGQNALLFNAEFRLPLFKSLSKKHISSNFFRNFNFVTFFDAGSAWNGKNLLPTKENINTRLVQGAPNNNGASTNSNAYLEINVRDVSSPWLMSYGMGVHTSLFGYQLKVEYAKPIVDTHINEPKFLISFGREF